MHSVSFIKHSDTNPNPNPNQGANDGLHMSNSYFFSKTLGWRALLVEGNPDVYKRIARHLLKL